MAWNNGEPRYDLRWWITTSEGEKCGKGVGLSGEALIALGNLITKMQEPEKKEKPVACKAKRNATTTKKK